MSAKSYIPHPLPIKNLQWADLVPWIGKAREALGRYDERLKKMSPRRLKSLQRKESIASSQGQDRKKISYVEEALDFAIRWAKKKPLNLQFLCQIHAIVKKDAVNPQEIGRLRAKQNWIGPQGCEIGEAYFFPPKPETIKKHMQALLRYLRTKEKDPLVQLAIFFAQFLIIHPFMDGNGRLVRIFVSVWLWKTGLTSQPSLFLSSYFGRNRLLYFRKLFHVSEKKAWEEWIIYFLKGIIEQSQNPTSVGFR